MSNAQHRERLIAYYAEARDGFKREHLRLRASIRNAESLGEDPRLCDLFKRRAADLLRFALASEVRRNELIRLAA